MVALTITERNLTSLTVDTASALLDRHATWIFEPSNQLLVWSNMAAQEHMGQSHSLLTPDHLLSMRTLLHSKIIEVLAISANGETRKVSLPLPTDSTFQDHICQCTPITFHGKRALLVKAVVEQLSLPQNLIERTAHIYENSSQRYVIALLDRSAKMQFLSPVFQTLVNGNFQIGPHAISDEDNLSADVETSIGMRTLNLNCLQNGEKQHYLAYFNLSEDDLEQIQDIQDQENSSEIEQKLTPDDDLVISSLLSTTTDNNGSIDLSEEHVQKTDEERVQKTDIETKTSADTETVSDADISESDPLKKVSHEEDASTRRLSSPNQMRSFREGIQKHRSQKHRSIEPDEPQEDLEATHSSNSTVDLTTRMTKLIDMNHKSIRFFWETDAEGRLVFLTPEFFDQIHCEKSDFIGKTWIELATTCHQNDETIHQLMGLRDQADQLKLSLNYQVSGELEPILLDLTGSAFKDDQEQFVGYRGQGSIYLDDNHLTPVTENPQIDEDTHVSEADILNEPVAPVRIDTHPDYLQPKPIPANYNNPDDKISHEDIPDTPDTSISHTHPDSVLDYDPDELKVLQEMTDTPFASKWFKPSGRRLPPIDYGQNTPPSKDDELEKDVPPLDEPDTLTDDHITDTLADDHIADAKPDDAAYLEEQLKLSEEFIEQLDLSDDEIVDDDFFEDDNADLSVVTSLNSAERNNFEEIAHKLGTTAQSETELNEAAQQMLDDEEADIHDMVDGRTTFDHETRSNDDMPLIARSLTELDGGVFEADIADPDDLPFNPVHVSNLAHISNEATPLEDEAPAPPIDMTSEMLILNRLPEGVLIYRGDEIMFANRAFLQLLGYDSADQLRERGGVYAIFANVGEDENIEPSEYKLTRSDGSEIAIKARLQRVPWNARSAFMLTVSSINRAEEIDPVHSLVHTDQSHDITSPAGEDINRPPSRVSDEFIQILGALKCSVFYLDKDGIIKHMFGAQTKPFPKTEDAYQGSSFFKLFEVADRENILQTLEDAFEHKANLTDPFYLNVEVKALHDEPVMSTLIVSGYYLEQDDEPMVTALIKDNSEWKYRESDLLDAKSKAEEASSHKSDFLARISHEIRTPMNAILGFTEVMNSEQFGPLGNERYKNYVKDIHTSGEHVISLVDDLLDLARIEAGKIELSFTGVDMNQIMLDCTNLVEAQAGRAQVVVRTSLFDELPPVVADKRSIKQIILNLLTNAIKFTLKGGHVVVSTQLNEAGEVIVRVRDTGIGMSERELEQAFEPFNTVSQSQENADGQNGTGLGLSVTKALVEANRAEFEVESAVNFGTLIEIKFPTTRVLAE